MNDLKDKNIIVTGASGGIGNSIIDKLTKVGANILATGTKIEKLESLKNKFVITAISTHKGEEKLLISNLQNLILKRKNLLLILQPRHPDRANKIHLCQIGLSIILFKIS